VVPPFTAVLGRLHLHRFFLHHGIFSQCRRQFVSF
jgi:hypothetical protein